MLRTKEAPPSSSRYQSACMTADVGLASVLNNASYVNQLEHLGTFAFAGNRRTHP